MQKGTVISGTGHAVLLAAALFGMPEWRKTEPLTPAQVSEVSLISLSDFQAAQSAAPKAPNDQPDAPAAPSEEAPTTETPETDAAVETVDAVKPDAPREETKPDLGTFEIINPDVAVTVDSPSGTDDSAPLGLDTPLPNAPAQDGSLNSTNLALLAPATPNLAPRIDTSAAPKPPQPVKEAPAVVEEAKPEAAPAPKPEPVKEAAAPKEATTEITPEAVVQENPTTLKAATRPQGRPARVVAKEETKPKEEPQDAPKPKSEPKPAAAEPAPAQTETAAANPVETPAPAAGTRLGADFNSSQKQAIGDVVGKRWNKTLLEGKDNFETLVVVVRVKLNADGRVIGAVEAVAPSAPTGDYKVAFDAARRAILMAQPIPLPKDKFRDGDFLEIRFDPGRAAISLD